MARFLQLGPARIVNIDLICVIEPEVGEAKDIGSAKKLRVSWRIQSKAVATACRTSA